VSFHEKNGQTYVYILGFYANFSQTTSEEFIQTSERPISSEYHEKKGSFHVLPIIAELGQKEIT
jgi:hypothetical protein